MQNNLIYGKHPVLEAIKQNKTIDTIFIQKDLKGENVNEIRELARVQQLPVKSVPLEKLDFLTRKSNHQGVAAFLSMINYFDKDEILSQTYEKGESPLFLILDNVTDVRNFGAIARTALGTGVHAILIPAKGGAQINPDAMKASAGALNTIPICREIDLVQTVKWCKLNGIQVVVSDLKATKNLSEIDFTIPTAIVVGEEGEGVNQLLINRADVAFKIPILNNLDSYNVSVAAGMILYQKMLSAN